MSFPRASIIIPVYNRAHLIADTLDSVLNQSFNNWECLVIDDGSTDNTMEVVKDFCNKDERFKFYSRPQNHKPGGNGARNFGLGKSKGSFVNWLDSDDKLHMDHLKAHVEVHMLNDVDASISQANVFGTDPIIDGQRWANHIPGNDVITDLINLKVQWQTATVVWKRSSLKKRPFNENLTSSQEWTFHLNQIINGISFDLLDKETCFIREHSGRIGKMRKPDKFWSTSLSRFLILQKLKEEGLLTLNREQILLQMMFSSAQGALEQHYYNTAFRILIQILGLYNKSSFKGAIQKLLFFGFPVHILFGKGYRYFKIH